MHRIPPVNQGGFGLPLLLFGARPESSYTEKASMCLPSLTLCRITTIELEHLLPFPAVHQLCCAHCGAPLLHSGPHPSAGTGTSHLQNRVPSPACSFGHLAAFASLGSLRAGDNLKLEKAVFRGGFFVLTRINPHFKDPLVVVVTLAIAGLRDDRATTPRS